MSVQDTVSIVVGFFAAPRLLTNVDSVIAQDEVAREPFAIPVAVGGAPV
ncbi:hypothetical protein [Mycobacterium vicinigordonae]|uniref:Uncharacterized protein n=1 Tax=Mycobacterium vicinigordonae TaxID=1719132 RepID=A0A7D6DWT7_9MYCO|nr:hypothetical protein [Mycobacterium vicinigordonae]QLL06764.1 hypothetical protein H0P51_24150 [Mycobacterium vicinigordonae]